MNDVDDLSNVITLALLGDVDGDLEFFHELFDNVPDDGSATDRPTPLGPAVSGRSHRRRQRWLSSEDPTAVSVLVPSDWRQLARSYKTERNASEQENAKLRRLVDMHARTTHKMMKLVQKAATLASREIVATPTRALTMPYVGPSVNLFEISQTFDTLALRADTVLATSPLAKAIGNAVAFENRIVQSATGDAFETMIDATLLLPFDVELITKTLVANAMQFVSKKNQPRVETVCDDANFKVVQGVSRPKVKNGLEITKHGHLATRREPLRSDGSQLVLMVANFGFVVGSTTVVSITGTSSMVVESVPGHDSASLGPLSMVRWHREFHAKPCLDAMMPPAERAKWLHSFTAKSNRKAERHIDKITLAMENLLLASTSGKVQD